VTTWRLRLHPKGSWATPWRADSLFGAICWCWLGLFPESFEGIIAAFAESRDPPFMLSDAFPGDLLPLPLHVRPLSNGKKIKPPLFISQPAFQACLSENTTTAPETADKAIGLGSLIRTAIDRQIGTAADGQLYEIDIQHLTKPFETLSIYLRSERYLKELIACFKALALTGFGKKSSSGLGAFELAEEAERCDWLDDAAGANAFTTLSHFVPAPADPTEGFWRLHVTYPKFHANTVGNVFKGSIMMMVPGSVFRTGGVAPKPWYGSMIPMARPEMPKALHYALAFAIPIRLEERD
jgi:CRISPR-associated protein Csm4